MEHLGADCLSPPPCEVCGRGATTPAGASGGGLTTAAFGGGAPSDAGGCAGQATAKADAEKDSTSRRCTAVACGKIPSGALADGWKSLTPMPSEGFVLPMWLFGRILRREDAGLQSSLSGCDDLRFSSNGLSATDFVAIWRGLLADSRRMYADSDGAQPVNISFRCLLITSSFATDRTFFAALGSLRRLDLIKCVYLMKRSSERSPGCHTPRARLPPERIRGGRLSPSVNWHNHGSTMIVRMSCPSCRAGSRWSPVRTLPVAPLWCDLGFVPNSRGNKAAANLRPPPSGCQAIVLTDLPVSGSKGGLGPARLRARGPPSSWSFAGLADSESSRPSRPKVVIVK